MYVFQGGEKRLRVEKQDCLVAINDKKIKDFNSKAELMLYIDDIPDVSVTLRIIKLKYLRTEMIDEDTMKAQVPTKALRNHLKNWLEIKDGAPTMKVEENDIFCEKGDQLLKIGEVDVSQMTDEDEVRAVASSLNNDMAFIILRKEEARKLRLRLQLLEKEEHLRTF
eukprot:UN25733